MTQRVIKYRAWDNKYNCFSEEPFFRLLISKDGQVYNSEGDTWYGPGERYIIQFFTGLTDKHGKEIYEHDIMALKDASGKIKFLYVVKFEDAKFVLYHLNNDYGNWGDLHRAFELDFRDYEFCIVGNIYTTPELIENGNS